jgi:hypothetical protein
MMRKEMYIIRGTRDESYPEFTDRILRLSRVVCSLQSAVLKLTLTTRKPPSVSVIPFKKEKISVISVYKEDPAAVGLLVNATGFTGAWTVEEAVPIGYKKTWPDGEPTPGINLLTLFNKKPGIDYDTFIRRWHHGHTPLSLKIHPLWNYNWNVVKEPVAACTQHYDGIVEEHFRTKSDLLNIFKFFGNPLLILYRFYQVYTDTNGFLDYKKIETYLADEYHILSGK